MSSITLFCNENELFKAILIQTKKPPSFSRPSQSEYIDLYVTQFGGEVKERYFKKAYNEVFIEFNDMKAATKFILLYDKCIINKTVH